jgi:hypothetical protein
MPANKVFVECKTSSEPKKSQRVVRQPGNDERIEAEMTAARIRGVVRMSGGMT